MSNPLEEAMDRIWEAEQEHRRRTEFEKTGIDRISYQDGRIVITRISHDDFYKSPDKEKA